MKVKNVKNITNGDIIKALFDVREAEETEHWVFVTIYPDYNIRFIKGWWDAPYEFFELKKGE